MEGFADIEGPVRIGLWALIGWSGLVLLATVGLVALIIWYLRARGSRVSGPVENQRSPLEIALDRLQRLETGADQLEADPFVVEVSDIVRDYLETALRVPAREQTSEEFLQALRRDHGFPEILDRHMPEFLEQCDLVKFARQVLAETERHKLLSTAGKVVRETDAELTRPPEPEKMEVPA